MTEPLLSSPVIDPAAVAQGGENGGRSGGVNGLAIENLSFSYGNSPVFENLFLSVGPGRIAAISGPNGSGKTTLSKIISGLLGDEEVIAGNPVLTFDGKKEFLPAAVFQDLNSQLLYENIKEELDFFVKYSGNSPASSPVRIAEDYGFRDLLEKKSRNLSNGEKQRYIIGVSSAFSKEKLLVLDEPAAFLDARSAEQLGDLLLKMKKEGYSAVILGHVFKGLERAIDAFYLIEGRKLKKEGGAPSRQELFFRKRKKGELLLETGNLGFGADGLEILKGVNLKVFSGRIKGVCGRNGCGKTTLAKILAGIKEGYSGDILLKGKKASPGALRGGAFIILANPFNQLLYQTVSGNIKDLGTDPEILKEKLAGLRLLEKLESPVSRLSYGEMQKLLILCGAEKKTPLMIVDEPLLSLDAESEKSVFEILDGYAAGGGSVLLVSHREELVRGFCDEIYHMENGSEEDLEN